MSGSRFSLQSLGAWAANVTARLVAAANASSVIVAGSNGPVSVATPSAAPAPAGRRRAQEQAVAVASIAALSDLSSKAAAAPLVGAAITQETMRAAGLSTLEAAALPVVVRLWRAFEPHFLRSEAALTSSSGSAFSTGTVAAAVANTPPAESSIAYGALKTWLLALAAQLPDKSVGLYAVLPAEAPSFTPTIVLPAIVGAAFNMWVVVGACLGGVAGCCCLFFVVAAVRRRRKQKEEKHIVEIRAAVAARSSIMWMSTITTTTPNPVISAAASAAAAAAIARSNAAMVAAEARPSLTTEDAGDVAVPSRVPSRRNSFAPSAVPSHFTNVHTYSSAASVAAALAANGTGDATPMGSPARVNIIAVAGSGNRRSASALRRTGSRSVLRMADGTSAKIPRVRKGNDGMTGLAGGSSDEDEAGDANSGGGDSLGAMGIGKYSSTELSVQDVDIEGDSMDSPRVAPAPVSVGASSGRLSRFPSAVSMVSSSRPALLAVEALAGEAPLSITPRVRSGSMANTTRPVLSGTGSGARAARAARVAAALTPLSVEFTTVSPGGACPTSPGGSGYRGAVSPRTPSARRRTSSRNVRRSGFGPVQVGSATPTPTEAAAGGRHMLQTWPSNFGASVPTGASSARRPRLTSSGLAIDSPLRRASVCSLSTPPAAAGVLGGSGAYGSGYTAAYGAGGAAPISAVVSFAPTPLSDAASGYSPAAPAPAGGSRAGVIIETGVMLMQRGAQFLGLNGNGNNGNGHKEAAPARSSVDRSAARTGALNKKSSFFSLPMGESSPAPAATASVPVPASASAPAPAPQQQQKPAIAAPASALSSRGVGAASQKKATASSRARRGSVDSVSWQDVASEVPVVSEAGEKDGSQAPSLAGKPHRRRSSIVAAVTAAAALLVPPSLQSTHSPRKDKDGKAFGGKDKEYAPSAQSPSISALRSPGGFLVAHATAALHAVAGGLRSRRGSIHGDSSTPVPARSRRSSLAGLDTTPAGCRPSLAAAVSSEGAVPGVDAEPTPVQSAGAGSGLLRRLTRRVFGSSGQGEQADGDGDVATGPAGPWIPETAPRSSPVSGLKSLKSGPRSRRGSIEGPAGIDVSASASSASGTPAGLPPLKQNTRFADIIAEANEGVGEATPMSEAEADALARGTSGLVGLGIGAQ